MMTMDEFDKIFSSEERKELRAAEMDFLYDVEHGIRYEAYINYALLKDLLDSWLGARFSERLLNEEFTDDEDFVLGFVEELLHSLYIKMNEDNPDIDLFD
jgi:hypothetical protein